MLIIDPYLKIAMCGVCIKSLSNRLKVSCSDCNKDFHGSCVEISKSYIDYLGGEQMVWRCEPCNTQRRGSLRLESKATEGKLSLEEVREP